MKTYSVKAGEIKRGWHLIDADDKVLGTVATEAAKFLMGKHKPIFSRHLDTGDFVVVINAARVKVTGKKLTDKLYHRHSGFPGGFKTESLAEVMATKPELVIERAVRGMLPRNHLGEAMSAKLRVFSGSEHPYKAQLQTVEAK